MQNKYIDRGMDSQKALKYMDLIALKKLNDNFLEYMGIQHKRTESRNTIEKERTYEQSSINGKIS